MRTSSEKLLVQRMESLPVPHNSTILPPPLADADPWGALDLVRLDETYDPDNYDPAEWEQDTRPTDVDELCPFAESA